MLISFVDVENTSFDDPGTIFSLTGEGQAQLTGDLSTSNRDRRNVIGKRDGCPAVRFPDPQLSHQFFFLSKQHQHSVWVKQNFLTPLWLEDIMSDTEPPSFEEYDFDHGDRVRVDWTDGQGPLDQVVGTISGISRSAGDVIVAVEADDDQYPDNSLYYGTHDCAPEWVEPLEQS